ncbi:MAG: flavin-containing monooxygenase [Acidimicrobiia bacterium]
MEVVKVIVVGAGFAGLAMADRLRREGTDDFVVLERADEIGGTWRDNTYPGCACDVPSHLYSYSFAPNPEWARSYSPQPEIQAYLRRCAEGFGVLPHVRFGHEVVEACWDDETRRWLVQAVMGGSGRSTEFSAQFLVAAMGALSEPAVPDLPGLSSFGGTMFHSARWDHRHSLAGERVAVIGTGASAVQFVPRIQPVVAHLDVYQRTPPWVVPRRDRAISAAERWLYRRLPVAQAVSRSAIYWARELVVLGFTVDRRFLRGGEKVARAHLRHQVIDPALRAALTPDYTLGCKRILLSDDYFPALTEDNVDVVTSAIVEVRSRSVLTADGVDRPADTIILGTGFHVTDYPAAGRLRGRHGRLLADAWHDGMRAYKGTTVAGFPNLFLLVGPNTGLGHSSLVYMIEAQVDYVTSCLRALGDDGLSTVEVRPQALEAYTRDLEARSARSVWTTGGCRSWYLDDHGHNTTLWPTFTFRFRRQTRRFDPDAYITAHGPGAG